MSVLDNIQTKLHPLTKLAAIFSTLAVIGGVGWFYYANIWQPNIKVLNVDYEKGIAEISVNGRMKTVYADSVQQIGASWGVRFANDKEGWTRLELVKNELVYKTLAIK